MKFRSPMLAALLLVAGAGAVFGEAQQRRTIEGRVVDQAGLPLPTAHIAVRGTNIGTLARADGTFALEAPDGAVVLQVNPLGYQRADVELSVDQTTVEIALETDVLNMDEIVVTGHATGIARRNLANAVTTVSSEELNAVSATSVDQALMGKVVGAEINKASGAPGGGVYVNLRGVTSINGAFTPLYVIDGVIASDVALPRGTNFITQASRGFAIASSGENVTNRIADLNPNDIESIEVLKGAAASAIYGSKASNGVIIITTKRGRGGAPEFNFSQRFGFSEVRRKMGFRRFNTLDDAVAVYGDIALDPDIGWAPDRVYDNEDYLVGGKPLHYEAALSLSGGSDASRYYASLLVRHEGGIITNTFADKRGESGARRCRLRKLAPSGFDRPAIPRRSPRAHVQVLLI